LNLHIFSILGHNGVQLGLEFPPKIAAWFPGLLSPRYQPLFYFFIFILKNNEFLRNNPELGYDNGHASNISKLIDLEDCRLYRMKSYDFHIFIQTLISLAYLDLLPKRIWDALMEINHFFRDITYGDAWNEYCPNNM
jgi:hypothetical protein